MTTQEKKEAIRNSIYDEYDQKHQHIVDKYRNVRVSGLDNGHMDAEILAAQQWLAKTLVENDVAWPKEHAMLARLRARLNPNEAAR